MSNAVYVKLPKWAFDASYYISEKRSDYFKNRFKNIKLRKYHKNEEYWDHIESILGYLGDIACSDFLDLDPKKMLEDMILSTDCLTHRNTHDITYSDCHLDVKVEDYANMHHKVICGTIRKDDIYGCRLINKWQWEENGENIDIYVFGAPDEALDYAHKIHEIQGIYLIGFIFKADAEQYPFAKVTPGGGHLHTLAKIIPNEELRAMDEILKFLHCGRPQEQRRDDNLKEERCKEALLALEEIYAG